MSRYREAVKQKRAIGANPGGLSEEQKANYPEIAALFLGEKDEKGFWDPSPCTISLFYNEGRLTACVKPKHDNLIAFITIGESEAILEALEGFFCKHDLEWKVPAKKK